MVQNNVLCTKIYQINIDKLTYAGNLTSLESVARSGRYFFENLDICSFNDIGKCFCKYKPDAVVHLAAIPRILLKPDNETFRINTLGTYNVIEAATKLGIKKIIFASSETTYGFCFAQGNPIPKWLPIEEDYETNPTDSYGLSKVLNEQTGKAFQKRTGFDIYALRIGNIIEPNEYHRFEEFCKNPSVRLRNLFNYIDARDLAQAIELCIKKDGLGYAVFNVTHNTNSVRLTTEEIINKFYPNVKIRREMEEYESILSSKKIRDVLGFNPVHDWRNYFKED